MASLNLIDFFIDFMKQKLHLWLYNMGFPFRNVINFQTLFQ